MVSATLRARGADAEIVLSNVGLADVDTWSQAGRISHACLLRLFSLGTEVTGDEAFGLHVAESLYPGGLGAIDYLVRTSPTLGHALRRSQRYQRLIQDGDLDVEVVDGRLIQRYRLPEGRQMPRPLAECVLGGATVWTRQLTGTDTDPLEVHFADPKPRETGEYQRFFRAKLCFGSDENAIVFSADILDLPLVGADRELGRMLDSYASHLMDRLACVRASDVPITSHVSELDPAPRRPPPWAAGGMNRLKRRLLLQFASAGGDLGSPEAVESFWRSVEASIALLPRQHRNTAELVLAREDGRSYQDLAEKLSGSGQSSMGAAAVRQRVSRCLRELERILRSRGSLDVGRRGRLEEKPSCRQRRRADHAVCRGH